MIGCGLMVRDSCGLMFEDSFGLMVDDNWGFLTFLTFLDHLLVQGRPVFESSSIFGIVPCFSQSVFLHVSLYVVPLSLSWSASAPSPRDL